MNPGLNELHLRRGRLLERIATQRAALRRDAQPVYAALYKTDRVLARVRAAVDYVKQHPSIAALGVAALFFMKGNRVWRLAKRGFIAWRVWQTFGNKLAALRGRS
jgi:hypothetical protein